MNYGKMDLPLTYLPAQPETKHSHMHFITNYFLNKSTDWSMTMTLPTQHHKQQHTKPKTTQTTTR